MTRSTEITVTFRRPFALAPLDGVQPAGVAFRRVATLLHVAANPAPGDTCQVVPVSPDDFAVALAADAS